MRECVCEYYEETYCDDCPICSKRIKEQKDIRRRIKYGESESLFNIE